MYKQTVNVDKMFASQLLCGKSGKLIATTVFVRCKSKTSSVKKITPFSDFIKEIDEKQFTVKFNNIPELHNAPEKVKKLFTIEYGNDQDKKEFKIRDLISKIDSEKQCQIVVSKIVEATVSIKEKQELYLDNRRKNRHLVKEIVGLAINRTKLLDQLRDHHFEIYANALTCLNLEHDLEPQYSIKSTALAAEVADMRIRAFAEARKKAAIAKTREDKLLRLKEKYQQKLSASDNC